ncbi:hypothetical protein LE190_16025 [Massilia oculi]|uniref:Uncharacterized protein n=1 Tax=Massilia hydrophila TaxID=3044279 RepID=A0ABS7YEQ4_9BURK|nr:hypothetical protein [Massilia oculi]MCA1857421.1 hypothetical protein [Massilia oculi]
MARGPLHRGSLRPKEEQLAARAAAVAKITELLQEGPMTAGELLAVVGGLRPTFSNWMSHMHKKLRLIRMTGEYRNRGEIWELGADPALSDPDDELDNLIAPKQGIHPATQIGIPRDPLVAALFGPAANAHREAA